MDESEAPLDFYLTEADRALLLAPSIHELVGEWQRAASAGLAILASGGVGQPGAAGRLSRALSAGAALSRSTNAREVAAAAARICAEVAADRAESAHDPDEEWARWAAELSCWAWLAA